MRRLSEPGLMWSYVSCDAPHHQHDGEEHNDDKRDSGTAGGEIR